MASFPEGLEPLICCGGDNAQRSLQKINKLLYQIAAVFCFNITWYEYQNSTSLLNKTVNTDSGVAPDLRILRLILRAADTNTVTINHGPNDDCNHQLPPGTEYEITNTERGEFEMQNWWFGAGGVAGQVIYVTYARRD
jgi:hypothetical protein